MVANLPPTPVDVPQPPDPAAWLEAAEAACARNDHVGGATFARHAIDSAQAAGDAASLARARAVLARVGLVTGEFEDAGRLARQALDHATVHGPPALLAQACNTLSFVYDRAGESLALNRLGVAVRGSEESARAIGMLEASVQIARTLPRPDAAFYPLNNLASRWIAEADRLIHIGGDPRAALQSALAAAREGEAIARDSGVRLQRAMISANLAGIHRRLGEYEPARARFGEAIALAHSEGAAAQETTFRLALASLEVEAAPSMAGCVALEQTLDAFPPGINAELALRARRVLAQAYRALGEADRACAQWERVLTGTEVLAGQRADAQWRMMQAREELARARHEAECAQAEAQVQRVRAEADAALAHELARHRDRLESEVAARTRDLQQALVAAEAASRAKSAFLALVGHELRTPLSGVLGMVELARRRATDPRQLGHLDKALAAGRGLVQLVEQLLEFVADPAPAPAAADAVDVRRMLAELLLAAQPDAQGKGLALTLDVADDVPAVVWLDALLVRRVLATLVGNALKFSDQGPVIVTAQRAPGSQDAADALAFEVVDHGPGIAPELRQRLFRPFEPGDISSTRTQGGLGLGLALVGRWVQAMGARIDVDSEPGRGSTFRVTVPLHQGP